MQFNYVAYTLKDGLVKGQIEAENLEEARVTVEKQGYRPLRVSQAWRLPGLEDLLPTLFRVGTAELIRFSRQLATMLESGANLMRTLEMLHEDTSNRIMHRTIGDIIKTLNQGGSLSTAMEEHPKIFSPLFVSVVEVGEYTGNISVSLNQMSEILQKEYEARQKAMQTMMYPLAIIGLSMITMVVLMTVALPPLLDVFEELDSDIPKMTQMAVGGSRFVKDNIINIPVGFVGVVLVILGLRRIYKVRYFMDSARLRTPVLGSLTLASELARYSRTTAMLLEAGLPLAEVLKLGRGGCGNLVLLNVFTEAEESLMSGHGLAESFKDSPVLPRMFVQLVTIGEESNSMHRTLSDAANVYQKQHEQKLDSLLKMIEPISTVVVGAIVGFIALSMFMPIYSGISAIE